jgi:ubiquinone biosynthesis protein UbiJ
LREDPSSDKKATFEWPFSLALNHLLDAEPWARERLAPFAGEAVELRALPLPALRFTILPGGRVEAGGEEPGLVVTIKPEILTAMLHGEEHVLKAVQVSGNARLADEVMALVRHLRWDAEEDLSKVVGDVAAHRIVQAARDLAAWQADAARRLAESFAGYAVDESELVLGRAEFEAFAAAVARLRDAVERLEKRIARLG